MNKDFLIYSHLFLAAILIGVAFYVEEPFLRRGSYLSAIGIAYMVVKRSNVDEFCGRTWWDHLFSVVLVCTAAYSIAFLFFAYSTFEIKLGIAALLALVGLVGGWRIKRHHKEEC